MRLKSLHALLWLCTWAGAAMAQEPAAPAEPGAADSEQAAPASSESNDGSDGSGSSGSSGSSDATEPAAAAQPAEPASEVGTIPLAPGSQEPLPAVSETDAPTLLDAIEVTAQRRTQKLQDVPVAVTAFTRDQVESRGITRLDDLNSLAPGLQISRSPSNTTISQLTIRASSQINPAIYWDPAVGVYLDNVYIGKAQGSIFDVVDLAGIEVLRGPQGTLYGRNTIAGTINLVTREPSGVFSGSAALEYGKFNSKVARASIDLPRLWIADFTIGVRSERRDGWVDEINDDPVPEMNNRRNDGLHLAANLALWPGVEGLYRFDKGKVDQTNNYLQLYRSDDPALAQYVDKERQTQADINSPPFEKADIDGHSFTLIWNFDDDNALKSISGYRKVLWADSLDLDGSPDTVAFTQRYTDYEQRSQDLQLIGSTARWNYVGGVYYFADDGYTNNPQHFLENSLNFDSRYGTQTDAWAIYGQVDWRPLDPLTLTAGLRYTREEKGLDRVFGFTPVAPLPPPLPSPEPEYVYYIPEGFHVEEKFSAATPLAAAAWKFGERVNVYLRYAEGFKSGGFNGEFSSLTETPERNQEETRQPFRPEHQQSLELGLKTSFFGGRALANVAAFHNKLTDLQISIFDGEGAASSTIRNAGKATVRGIELETALIPFEGTTLRVNYAFLDPKYDEFLDGGENVADNRAFVHAPEHSYNVVLDTTLLDGGWGALRAVIDYVWTDEFYTYPYQLGEDPNPPGQTKQEAEDTKVQAYGVLNARLALTALPAGATATIELALWGRNLLDEDAANNFIDFGPGAFQSLTTANFVEPRTLGVAGILRW